MESEITNKEKKETVESMQSLANAANAAFVDVATFNERIVNIEVKDTIVQKKFYVLEEMISLQEFLSILIHVKGTFQSLGKAYNSDQVCPGMEITISYVVPGKHYGEFNNRLGSLMTEKRELANATKESKK